VQIGDPLVVQRQWHDGSWERVQRGDFHFLDQAIACAQGEAAELATKKKG
jgi:hypothetical protein